MQSREQSSEIIGNFIFCHIGDRTQGLANAGQVLSHSATPSPKILKEVLPCVESIAEPGYRPMGAGATIRDVTGESGKWSDQNMSWKLEPTGFPDEWT